MRRLLLVCCVFLIGLFGRPPQSATAELANEVFVVKPYLQLGDTPSPTSLTLLWHAPDKSVDWSVDYRASADHPWQLVSNLKSNRVAVVGIEPHKVYRATLTGLVPGCEFSYRVSQGKLVVFSADAHAPKSADQPYRFVAFGDCGTGTPEQKAVAYQTYQLKPDFVMIPGDVVYSRGRVSEYRDLFWPVYNTETPSPSAGAPLLRSTLFIAAPGNHDIGSRDLIKYPDGLAYFLYWDQPLNGLLGKEGGPLVPKLVGPEANTSAFVTSAGTAYPRMANFSFNYGNAHWTILDANPYVDWTDSEFKSWIERDLASASGATWRFVVFHQPGFNSSRKHFDEQYTRRMAPIFESGKVDVVFTGHVHNYQRSYPLGFVPSPVPGKKPAHVDGKWTLDKSYNGQTDTTPEGVIYLVTGAGGQHLYDPEQNDDPASWQPFTHKFYSKGHSMTVADVNGPTLTIRQITPEGTEIDKFVVTKK